MTHSTTTRPSFKTTTTTHQLRATVINWDDESNSYNSTYDEPTDDIHTTESNLSMSTTTIQQIFTSIAHSLTHSADNIASLARLAVVFSPPDRAVKLKDINQIHIIKVTNNHIEISVVVCDETECITLLVPVTFRQDCSCCSSDELTEACVLDNIFELDVEAQQVLKQRNLEYNQGGTDVAENGVLATLYNDNDVQFPTWWISPNSKEIFEECQLIKNILNQDNFQPQVKALAWKGLALCEDGDLFEIHKAVVCSIGPSGLFFRAIATKKDEYSSQPNTPMNKETHCTILDIPLSIHADTNGLLHRTDTITDPSVLRAAILGAVASVEEN